MIIYAETNFLVEWTCRQEQTESCGILLQWSAERRIDLRIPAEAFTEAYTALQKKVNERRDVKERLERQARDFRRVNELREPAVLFEDASRALSLRSEQEDRRFTELAKHLRRDATIIPLDAAVLGLIEEFRSLGTVRGEGDLHIFASVMANLMSRNNAGDTAPSLFATRDRGFEVDAANFLRPFNCTLLTSYPAAVSRLRSLS